jgi:SPW repeat
VGFAGHWWFWVLAAAALVAAGAFSGRYRMLAARLRGAAQKRGLIKLPAGRSLDQKPRGFWSELSWLAVAAGIWVVLGPWIWGYDDVGGAVATDALTGGAVIVLAIGGIVYPALWSLNLLAGLWLVTAPWLVGYGDANGPVGLSDSIAGVLVSVLAIASLSVAERALRPGGRVVGRIRPRG